jgi:hypothetical protein
MEVEAVLMTRVARIAGIVLALAVIGPFWLAGEWSLHAKGIPKEPESEDVRHLKLAFGPECDELSRRCRIYLRKFDAVFAFDRAEARRDGQVEYEHLSVAQFRYQDGKDIVVKTIRDSTAIGPNVFPKIVGDSITFECESGVQLRIERAR